MTRRSRSVSTRCSKGSAARERSRGAVILLDTSGLLAALVPDQRDHEAAARILIDADVPLVLSPFVLAELDYLIGRLLGTEATVTLLGEVARGAYRLAAFGADDIARARDIIKRYADLGIGLADASIVVLADALGTRDVLTLDERHFRALRRSGGGTFRLLPRDR